MYPSGSNNYQKQIESMNIYDTNKNYKILFINIQIEILTTGAIIEIKSRICANVKIPSTNAFAKESNWKNHQDSTYLLQKILKSRKIINLSEKIIIKILTKIKIMITRFNHAIIMNEKILIVINNLFVTISKLFVVICNVFIVILLIVIFDLPFVIIPSWNDPTKL